MKTQVMVATAILLCLTGSAHAEQINMRAIARIESSTLIDAEKLADAIFLAEGGYGAGYLYGIRSVSYDTESEARRICINTINNNKKRYMEYGYKKHKTYLEFLASRYCPIGAKNDPKGLNKNWIKNVIFFLNIGKHTQN